MLRYTIPALVFAAFLALAGWHIRNQPDREIASAMIGKALPQFNLQPAATDRPGLATTDFQRGQPRLLNVFASWCIPCAVEAPQLAELKAAGAPIEGIAIRDRPANVAQFLARNGNPFTRIGADNVSAVQLGLGSSGVPETFVIDGWGKVRYQHIGEIRPEHVPLLLAKLKEAQR